MVQGVRKVDEHAAMQYTTTRTHARTHNHLMAFGLGQPG